MRPRCLSGCNDASDVRMPLPVHRPRTACYMLGLDVVQCHVQPRYSSASYVWVWKSQYDSFSPRHGMSFLHFQAAEAEVQSSRRWIRWICQGHPDHWVQSSQSGVSFVALVMPALPSCLSQQVACLQTTRCLVVACRATAF